ncbi:unnamed protein product, partial [Adineta steineri]
MYVPVATTMGPVISCPSSTLPNNVAVTGT